MKNQNLIIEEISLIRKRMGLKENSELLNIIFESNNKKIILEQGEVRFSKTAAKAIVEVFGEASEKSYNMIDSNFDDILRELNIKFPGDEFGGRSVTSLDELQDVATYYRANDAAGRDITDEQALKEIFSTKSQTINNLKNGLANGINKYSLDAIRGKVIGARNKFNKTSPGGKIKSTPETGTGGREFTESMAEVDRALDDFEKKYLGRDSSTTGRKTDALGNDATIESNDFIPQSVNDNLFKDKTSSEIISDGKKIQTTKDLINEELDTLEGKINSDNAGLTDEQVTFLKGKIKEMRESINTSFDNTLKLYNSAAKNKQVVEEQVEYTVKNTKTRDIYDVNDEKQMTPEQKNELEKAKASQADEVIGESNRFIRFYRNWVLGGGNKAGYGKQTVLTKSTRFIFQDVNEIVVQWWRRLKTTIQRDVSYVEFDDVSGLYVKKYRKGNEILKNILKEMFSEGPSRFSYAEVRARMQMLTNDMLVVVRESMSETGKQGPEALTAKLRNRLIELMKEMESLQKLTKFQGDREKILKLYNAAIEQGLGPDDIQRLLDKELLDPTAAGKKNVQKGDVMTMEFMFNEFKTLADDVYVKISQAAKEGVDGAAELKSWWDEAGAGGYKNIDNLREYLKGADDMMKDKKGTHFLQNMSTFLDDLKEISVIGKYMDDYMGEASYTVGKNIDQATKDLSQDSADDVVETMIKNSTTTNAVKEGLSDIGKFFKGLGKFLINELLINGTMNMFKYGFISSTKEIDRVVSKYGPIKSLVMLSLKQAVLGSVLSITMGVITEILLVLDKVLNSMFGMNPDGEYYLVPMLLTLGDYTMDQTELEKQLPAVRATVASMKEQLKKTSMERILSWVNPPVLKRTILGAGIFDVIGNIQSAYQGDYSIFKPSEIWTGGDKDYGLFNGMLDELLLSSCGLIISHFRDGRLYESDQLYNKFEDELAKIQKKIDNIKERGTEYAIEKADEINKTEDNFRQEILNYSERGFFGDEAKAGSDYYNKLNAVIKHEMPPSFESQLSNVPYDQRELKGKQLYLDWYKNNVTSVGITDVDGTFYKVGRGASFASPIQFMELKRGLKVNGVKGIEIVGAKVPLNLAGEPNYNPTGFYIYNPKNKILYEWKFVKEVITSQKLEEIYKVRKVEIDAQKSLTVLIKNEANLKERLKNLDEKISGWEEMLKKYEGKTDTDLTTKSEFPYVGAETKLTYPETVQFCKAQLYGGTYTSEYVSPSGEKTIRTKEVEKGLYAIRDEKKKEYDKIIKSIQDLNKTLNENIIKKIIMSEMKKYNRYRLFEEEEQRFGENKFDHWYDTFTFQKYDEKNNDFKDIDTDTLKHGKIKERFNDFIKNYDGDDAFVRAVVDTHPEVVRIKYLKDQANIQETYYPTGLASVLSLIRESKGEYEIFSVSRLKGGNWHLVKGDFTQKEMSNMVLTKQVPPEKQPKQRENGLESLKKKESAGTTKLVSDETEGLKDLPKRVKEKLREKMSKGWTTETPPKVFHEFYEESELNSVFNDKIKIYKLNSTPDFFKSLKDNSSHVLIRKGFCRSMTLAKRDGDISNEQRKVVNHILNKCDEKFEGRLGLSYLSKKV